MDPGEPGGRHPVEWVGVVSVHELEEMNPWVYCVCCGDKVKLRAGDRNLPCRCVAAVRSECATWDEHGRCRCDDVDDPATALQAALEDQERELTFADVEAELVPCPTCAAAQPSLLILPTDIPSAEVAAWAERFAVKFPPGTASSVRVIKLPVALAEPGDEILTQAARWKAVLSWVGFCGFLLLMAGLWAYGRPW